MDILKALDLNSSAASYLLPRETVNGVIRDYTDTLPYFYNAVNKVPWASPTYYIKKKLTMPTASWGTDGGPLPAATHATFGEAFKSMRYLYTRGEVTGPMQAAAGSLFNALAGDIQDHQKAIVKKLSQDLIDGDGAANDITGILYQITDDPDMSGGTNANEVITASGALTLAKLDEWIDDSDGATAILTSKPVRRKLNSLLQAQQVFNDRVEVAAGFRVASYQGLPIFTTTEWEENKLLLWDRSEANLLVHKDFFYEDLAKTKDSFDYFIGGYFGFSLEGSATLVQGFTL
jgi:hypothetical protein